MKRPLFLLPLLALALPALAQDPATNAVAAKEAAVRAKLDAIVFDSLEYQDANAADVISDLCERAREMDKDEPDPAKKGVSVVVGVDVKDIDEILARTTVTLKERSVSLGSALDRVADAIGLKVRVVGGCVLLARARYSTSRRASLAMGTIGRPGLRKSGSNGRTAPMSGI